MRSECQFGLAALQLNSIVFNAIIRPLLSDDTVTSWDGADGLLSKIILYDQFPRLIFRGTSRAFSFDSKAIAAATTIYNDSTLLNSYSAIELFFIGVCLQHSEQLHHQEMGLKIAELINSSAPKDVANFISNLKGYPHEHYEVIMRFGRFPSRNMALDRETTPEEAEWLASPSSINASLIMCALQNNSAISKNLIPMKFKTIILNGKSVIGV